MKLNTPTEINGEVWVAVSDQGKGCLECELGTDPGLSFDDAFQCGDEPCTPLGREDRRAVVFLKYESFLLKRLKGEV